MRPPIRELLQQIGVSIAARAGLYPSALTDAASLRALLEKLAPVRAGKELIRLGPLGDGGYLVPDDLDGITACFSPGVSSVAGFDFACAERGMDVFLADRTVERPPVSHPRFRFTRKHVGATTDEDTMTMDAWVSASVPEGTSDLLLQMDIEGAEYETLLATPDRLLRRFRVIVVELHLLDHFWSKPFFRVASAAIHKVLQTHACVHVHPNNCCGSLTVGGLRMPRVAEATFLLRDRVTGTGHARQFPHPLDVDNERHRSPLPLPSGWIGGE